MKFSLPGILFFLMTTITIYSQSSGSAIKFDGVDDYASATLNTGNTNSTMTTEFWFARVSDQAGTIYLADLHSISGSNNRCVRPFINNGEIGVYAAPNTDSETNAFTQYTGVVPAINIWTHIAVTISDATLRMYVNGKLEITVSLTDSYALVGTEEFYIGTDRAHSSTHANIRADEIRIWSSERTQAQIQANMYKELTGGEANLLAYYKVNTGSGTTLEDSQTAGSYDGTISGGNTWITSGAFAETKYALNFDAIDDYVDCGNGAEVQFNGSQNFTVEAWVKPAAGIWGSVVSKFQHESTHEGYSLEMYSDRRVALLFGNNWSDWTVTTSTNQLTLNTWHHIAATYDGSTVKIYIDGHLEASAAWTNGITDSGTPLVIGARMGTTVLGTFFAGSIDEVRVWNSVRTEAQLRENMCKTLVGNEANLKAYYRLDENDGNCNIAYDYSGSGYNGTMMNNPLMVPSDAFNTWIGAESDNWTNSGNWTKGVPTSDQSVGMYKWSLGSDAKISSTPTVRNLLISSTSSPILNSNFTVNRNLILENDLNLNGYDITLSSESYLLEGTGKLSGVAGTISTTRNLSNLSSVNVAGLGAVITTAANMGSTTIARGHTVQTGNGNSSIQRYYNITPTNNSSLNATLVFNYLDTEKNGLTEANFILYKSTDNGTTWTDEGGTLNDVANTITKTGISSFSRWTVGDCSQPLVLPIPAVLGAIEGSALSYTEGSGEVQITNTITVDDADDTNLESAVVQITGNYQSAEDELTFVNQNGITGSWNSSLGKMTLTGSSSLANYQTALRSVKYGNNSQSPNTNERTVSFTVNDGDNNSNTITRNITLTVLASNPTVVINSGGSVNEGGTLILNDEILKAGDEDGPSYSLTYYLTEGPKHGTISSSFTQNDIANGKVTYIHDASEAPADTFKFVVVDEDGNSSDESTFVITIIGVNDTTVITGVPSFIMNEDEELTITRSSLLNYVSDVDDPDSLLTITLQSATPQLAVTESGNDFILSVTENWFGNASCIFTAGDGKATASGSVNVTVNSVNDLPVLSGLPSSIEFLQTGSATIDLNGTGSDVETADSLLVFSFSADPDSINVSYNNQTGIATITSAGNFTGNATLTVTVTDADGGIVSGTTNVTVTPEVVGIEQLSGIPEQYSLYQNYPNPFNPTTKIKFGLPEASQVSLKIYDMLGREIAILANSILPTGYYEYNWNATDNASGIYFCVLSTSSNNSASAGYREIRKMLLIK